MQLQQLGTFHSSGGVRRLCNSSNTVLLTWIASSLCVCICEAKHPPALILSHLECPSGDRCGGGETPHRHKLLKDRMTVILLMLTPKAMDINIVALASQSGGCFLLCFFV